MHKIQEVANCVGEEIADGKYDPLVNVCVIVSGS